jgi:heme/copper-type cytochrome/quinol oxidase subunit 2
MIQNIALYNSNVTIIMVVVFIFVCLILLCFFVKSMLGGEATNSDDQTDSNDE